MYVHAIYMQQSFQISSDLYSDSVNRGFVRISVIAWFYTKDVTLKNMKMNWKWKPILMAVNSMNYEVIKRDIHNSLLFKPLSLMCEQY